MITWQDLLKSGISVLEDSGIEDARFDATQLIEMVYGGSLASFIADRETFVPEDKVNYFNKLIDKRADNHPLQYLLGEWDFYESSFYVGEGVLIPRSETEELVDICSDLISRCNYQVIYDLCAGSGCIGLSLAKKFPHIKCYLFELYDVPLKYIKKNAERLNVNNIEIIKCDILNPCFKDIPAADIIVSNPPYIQTAEIQTLQSEVLNEPVTALDGGEDGLIFYRRISVEWLKYLSKGSSLALECGEEQADSIKGLLSGFEKLRSTNDLYGVERFVIAEKYLKGDI